jgi:Na+-transporting NADH:ubiquinone oxidoreductase subunit F
MSEIAFAVVLFTLLVLALAVVVMAARAVLLPSRAVTVTVNSGEVIPARTGDKLLTVLTDNGIPVPSPCGGKGTCGQCRVGVTSGGGEVLPVEMTRLSRSEIREGLRLSCQVTLREDASVRVPEDVLGAEVFGCTVVSVKTLSPLIREVVFERKDGKPFEFRAGAYAQVTAPAYRLAYSDIEVDPDYQAAWDRMGLKGLVAESSEPVTRAYSVASVPGDEGRIVLFVRLAVPPPHQAGVPPGIVSSWIFGLKPGDSAELSGPYGHFRAADTDREMVFIGGGVGMAPLRAIVFDQLERLGTKRKMSFWYGARSKIDLFHSEGPEALARAHDNFSWMVAMSDPLPEDKWDGPTGFVHSVVYENYLKDHPAPWDCEYYLCGPPLMIQAVLSMLDECGVDSESIYFDDFGT